MGDMVLPMSEFAKASGLTEPLRALFRHRTTGNSFSRDISDSFAFIGRHPQNTVQLDCPSVSKKHAYIQILEGSAFVVDLGSRSGIRVDGGFITEAWLETGHTLEIGDYDIRLGGSLHQATNRPSPMRPSVAAANCGFALTSATDVGGLIHCPLRCAITMIGRDPSCNFRLVDDRMRLFHAAVVQTSTDAWLVDLLGSGATRVNDRPIRSSILQAGDVPVGFP